MSRHHLLPPIAFAPPPPPQRNATRRRRVDSGEDAEIEEVVESNETGATNRATGAVARHPLRVFPATEAAGRKPHNPGGRLSESTLTAMLKVQELK